MEIKVYSTSGCFYCDQLKELFRRAELTYDLTEVVDDIRVQGEDKIQKSEFSAKYPSVSGFPYVIIDGEEIGGLVEAAKYFIKKGLVSARKD